MSNAEEVEEGAPVDKAHEQPGARSAAAQDTEVVVRSLLDLLIMPASMIQPQERAFAADLLTRVLPAADRETKRFVVDRVAGISDASSSLVRWMLAEFDDDLLVPLLAHGVSLSDSDLVALIGRSEPPRIKTVAQRRALPMVACAAVVEHGDRDAHLALLRNGSARIDEPTLMALTDKAQDDEVLGELLVTRPEMTPACGLKLFWDLKAKHRAYVLDRFLADCRIMPQVLVMARQGADLVSGALRCATRDGENIVQPQLAASAPQSRALAEELMAAIADADSEMVFSRVAELDLVGDEAAERIAKDEGGEALAVACKAAGASRFAFATAFLKRCAAEPETASTADHLQIIFDTLSFKHARMALTYWNWQFTGTGPYERIDTAVMPDKSSAA